MKRHIIRGAIKSLALLPLPMLYPLSDICAFVLRRVVRYRVDVVRGNLAKAFPEKTDKERRKIERRFYRRLCDIFIETAKLAHISDSEMLQRVSVSGMEHVRAALEQGESIVIMLGHFGNWEWVTSMALHFPPNALACEIYNPLHDRTMDGIMLELRSRFGTENIPMERTYRRLLEINRSNRPFICGFIADQRPFTPALKHWTDFMGIDTPYVDGGETIARRLGAKMLYCEMLPTSRGRYQMTLHPIIPIDDGEENPYTRAYLQMLERSIRRSPSSWLWSHKRWSRSR